MGLWSVVTVCEPNRDFEVMVICVQGACMVGTVVRNSAFPTIAKGLTLLVLILQSAGCLGSGSTFLTLHAPFIALHMAGAVRLVGLVHGQTMQLLRAGEDKEDMAARIAAANHGMQILNTHLRALAATDALTGLANRRSFDLTLAREWPRTTRLDRAMVSPETPAQNAFRKIWIDMK